MKNVNIELQTDENHPSCFTVKHVMVGGHVETRRGKRIRPVMHVPVYRCAACGKWLNQASAAFSNEFDALSHTPSAIEAPSACGCGTNAAINDE